MKKLTILLIFILLPTVYASSLTGSFTDYGNDTDTDGLYNYLTIQVGVDITYTSLDYIIYGQLKDSLNNIQNFDACIDISSTGIINLSLHFDGLELYRNQVDGPYTLTTVELSTISQCGSGLELPVLIDELFDAHTTQAYSYTDFQTGKPAISCNNSPCIAPPSLIMSRDYLNYSNGTAAPEPNTPNTIDGCEDGPFGFYQQSQSIESITVTSLNNTFFKVGDTVQIDIDVYCAYTFDKLNFVYSNDAETISWTVKDQKQCNSTGIETLSTRMDLDNKIGEHAIRGVFSFNTQPDTVCGQDDPQYQWADTDDIVIYVDYPITIDITEGWNLISLPKIQNNNITEISNLFNNFDKILALKGGKWELYDKTPNSNLDELSEADGFWIKSNETQTILIDDPITPLTSFNLKKGWNLIGYPSTEEKDINEVFQNVTNDIELIYIYNNEFSSFNPQKPTNINIKPGMGIFVKVKSDVSWYFDNTYKKGQLSFNLTLSEGWNLISLPLESNKTVSELFGSKTLYYLENNNWKQLEGSVEINYSHGYWINTTQGILPIEGYPINNLDYNINQGWNLINYPLTEQTQVDTLFQNVMDDIDLVNTYENGQWKTFSPSRPTELNSFTIAKPGKGIFIKAKNNSQWYFDGNEIITT